LPRVTSMLDVEDLKALLKVTKTIDLAFGNKLRLTFVDGSTVDIGNQYSADYLAGFLGSRLTNQVLKVFPTVGEAMTVRMKNEREEHFSKLERGAKVPTGVVRSLSGMLRQTSDATVQQAESGCESPGKRVKL